MEFKAFKMDGLGNDFVIIDQRHNHIELTNDQIKKICNRNFIGCDQLIFIKKNEKIDADIEFYIQMEVVREPVGMEPDVWLIYYQKK